MIRKITRVIIHCSATKPDQYFDVNDIRRWHVEDRGWSDIGYHTVITRLGIAQEGRPISRSGAHAKGHNHDSIGICMIGGIDKDGKSDFNFRRTQLETLKWVIDDYIDAYGPLIVEGHRDLPGVTKDCPCFDVRAWWDE